MREFKSMDEKHRKDRLLSCIKNHLPTAGEILKSADTEALALQVGRNILNDILSFEDVDPRSL